MFAIRVSNNDYFHDNTTAYWFLIMLGVAASVIAIFQYSSVVFLNIGKGAALWPGVHGRMGPGVGGRIWARRSHPLVCRATIYWHNWLFTEQCLPRAANEAWPKGPPKQGTANPHT